MIGTAGSTQDYGFRIYNPSLGRFLSVDPLTENYPHLTPYQFASNRPIDGTDIDGLEYHQNSKPGEIMPNSVMSMARDNTAITLTENQVLSAMTAKAYRKPEAQNNYSFEAPYDPAQANFTYNVKLYGPLAPGYTPITKYLKGEEITKTDWAFEAMGIVPFLKIGKLAGPLAKMVDAGGELITSGIKGAGRIGGSACIDFASGFSKKFGTALEEAGATVNRMEINIGANGFIGVADKQAATTGVHQFIEVIKDGKSMIFDNVFTKGIAKEQYMKEIEGFVGGKLIQGEQMINSATKVK